MSLYVLALLIGIISGLRSMMGVAAVSWAAQLHWIDLDGTRLGFLAATITPYLVTLAAMGELVVDSLPWTMSRKAPPAFGARLVTGALSGAAIGAAGGSWLFGGAAGVIGAVIGTLGGYDARKRAAMAFGRDLPAAILEDVIAVGGALCVVWFAR